MKKLLFFALMCFSFVTMAAQTTFSKVTSVVKENGAFKALVGDKEYNVSADQYLKMRKVPQDFYFAGFEDEADPTQSFGVFVHKSEFRNELLTVDSIGVGENGVEVYFTNGCCYDKASASWAKVLVGQTVQHTVIDCSRRVFEGYKTWLEVPEDFVVNIPQKEVLKVSAPEVEVEQPKVVQPKTKARVRRYRVTYEVEVEQPNGVQPETKARVRRYRVTYGKQPKVVQPETKARIRRYRVTYGK